LIRGAGDELIERVEVPFPFLLEDHPRLKATSEKMKHRKAIVVE